MSKKVAIVCTSASEFQGHPTGAWLEEIATPYYAFKAAGLDVTIVSIAGGKVPIDAASTQGDFNTPDCVKFTSDADAVKALESSVALAAYDFDACAGVYLAGGHGTCVDFYNAPDAPLQRCLNKVYADGKPLAADCHGPIALLNCVKPDGSALVADKAVTGFSDAEEAAVGLADKCETFSALLEKTMRALGGKYAAAADWNPNVCVDGNLITGQNPASSAKCAEAFVEALAA